MREKHQLDRSFTVNTSPANPIEIAPQNKFIFVKSEYENIKINTEDILYIQGLKDYIKIYTKHTSKATLTLMSFKSILEKLPNNDFLRVHKSYIINIQQIKALQKTKIIVGNVQIPIGDTFKARVLERLGV